jgi:cytochrome c
MGMQVYAKRNILRAAAGLASVAVLIAGVANGVAQSPQSPSLPSAPSPERGHELAGRLCSNCHLVEGQKDATVPAGIPTMRGIANQPGQTGQRILDVLIQPHSPMPELRLTIDEIRDLIAYFDTLRTDRSGPPLQSPVNPAVKPKRPQPS